MLVIGIWLQRAEHVTIQRTALANLMLDFNPLLRDDDDFVRVHNNLGPSGIWGPGAGEPETASDWTSIRRYMGLLEQIDYWRSSEIISIGEIDNTYSDRLARIYGKPSIQSRFLQGEPEAWTRLNALLSSLKSEPNFKYKLSLLSAVAKQR